MLTRLLLAALAAAAITGASPALAADPGQTGRWSLLQNYPVVPISAAVTPDGNIVAWDQADPAAPHSIAAKNGKAIVIDPDVGVIARSANLAPYSVFCPLITTLPDGKVAIAGGGNDSTNSDAVQIYDPESKTFGTWSTMSTGRWYPGGNITKNGDLLALGGRGGSGADVVDAATGKNRRLTVNFGGDWYPLALRMPDGRFTIENVTDLRTSTKPSRQILDINGTGTLTGADDLTLLQTRKRMTATMVGPYTMLGITGGTSRDAYLLDVSTGGRPEAKPTGSTKDPHITGTAVTLPDGSAFVVGGNSTGSETYGTPVFGTELWSPQTGQWTSMADTPRQRQYHSVSALLPDGRVWSAGTSINGSANEYNGAYFSPPYLFKKDGSGELAPRPEITEAPKSASWGERVTVRSPQAASIRKASLIRLSATTHQYDFSGTYVPLDVSVNGDQVSVDVPSNGNTVPAGQYMLFLVDSAGVPSKAATLRIDPAADSTPNATTMMSSQYAAQYPSWKGFDGDSSSNTQIVHTKLENEPWWQVDLGRSRPLTGLKIFNRTDSYSSRLRSAWIFASDRPFESTTVAGTRAQAGVTAVQLPGSVGATPSVTLNRTARYIRVQLPRNDYLHFREVVPSYGTVATPKLALTKVTQTDTSVTVKVANTGNATGTISSIALPGAGWAQAAGPGAPFTVAAGGETTLTLTRGTVDGDLVLTPSSGSALRLALERAAVANVTLTKVGQTDDQAVVRVANTGTAATTISSVALPGDGWAQVAGPGAPFALAAGTQADLTLTRGTVDGDLVVTPSGGAAIKLALNAKPKPSSVPDPSAGGWKLNGSATVSGGALQLTPAAEDQKGSAFWPTALDASGGLTVEFDAAIEGGSGADGLTMTLGDPSRGATASSLGGGGGSLGFGGIPGTAVALATFPNGTQATGDFVGISDGAAAGRWQTLSWLSSAPVGSRLQDTTRHVKVTIAEGTVTAAVDGVTVSHAATGTDRVLLGFTAATGGLTNRHVIRNLSVTGGVTTPPPTPEPTPSSVPDPAEGGWQLNGASSITAGKLQLTPPAEEVKGSAFWPTALDVKDGLTVQFDAAISDGTGADGLTFALADPGRGATARSLGGGGGSLGFGGIPGLAVGLASYPNGTQTTGNFVGISDGAAAGQWQTLSWLSGTPLLTPLQNTLRAVKVTITPNSVTAVVDGGVTVTRTVAVPAKVLLGFTAATGGLTNRHVISNVRVSAT